MARFSDIKTLQKFAAVHASIHNHFNLTATSTAVIFSSKTVQPPWPSGVNWRPEPLTLVSFVGQFRLV